MIGRAVDVEHEHCEDHRHIRAAPWWVYFEYMPVPEHREDHRQGGDHPPACIVSRYVINTSVVDSRLRSVFGVAPGESV